MFSCFSNKSGQISAKNIPVRVWDCQRSKKVGIVTNSLKDLKSKITSKYKFLRSDELEFVLEEDGTEVDEDEILCALPPHTVIMVLRTGQKWTPEVYTTIDDVERALTALLESNQRHKVTECIMDRIQAERDSELVEILGQIATSMGQNIQGNTPSEDPEWFKDQPSSRTTKEAVMRDCAKRRIRKYYNTALDHVKGKKQHKIPPQYQQVFDSFHSELRANHHHGDYFDRTVKGGGWRMCDSEGWFLCEGAYSVDKCSYSDHRINPYGSRANYLVFSTWNLDHRIEKSREILPQLILAVDKKPKTKDVNWKYFYDVLFTRKNLRLVHTSCHDKTEHLTEKCDQHQFYK